MKKRRLLDSVCAKKTLSLVLALVLLWSLLPQLTLPARALGDIVDYSYSGMDYFVDWDPDEWNHGLVVMQCPYCDHCAEIEISDGDHENAADELIDFLFPGDCYHCTDCQDDYHCPICKECYEDNAEECTMCNSIICLDCHEDDYFCDLCGNCRLEDGATGISLTGHTVDLPNLHALCGECLDSVEECVECSNVISIGSDYFTYEEAGLEWCQNCGLCHECATNPKVACDYGHCSECGVCGNDENVCSDCGLCDLCAEVKTHCPMCNLCWGEDGIEWCPAAGLHCVECDEEHNWICDQCEGCRFEDGTALCDECGLCVECCLENSEDEGCIHGFCIESADYYDHLCPNCGQCPEDIECEYCGMCEDCASDYHCEHDICPDNTDEWEEHLCDSCGNCFDLDELCEYCHMCEDCWDHCDHGICPEDPDYDDHICEQCGDCYEDTEFCDDCGFCVYCCEENSLDMGCDHGLCIESYAFQSHYCFTDSQCREYCSHDSGCTHDNVQSKWGFNETSHWHECEDCGAAVDCETHIPGTPQIILPADKMSGTLGKATISCALCGQIMEIVTIPYVDIPSDGSPYVFSQPKDYVGKVSDLGEGEHPRYASFSVLAGGDGELSYQWYQYKNGWYDPLVKLEDQDGEDYWYDLSGRPEIQGANTATLTVLVDEIACMEDYEYYCVITNAKGSVETRHAQMDAQHDFSRCVNNLDGTHSYYCVGDTCDKTKGPPSEHRYLEWQLKEAATATHEGLKEQVCSDCGAKNTEKIPKVDPDHVHSFTNLKYGMFHHWYECVCGERKDEQGHQFEAWGVNVLATVEKEGRREHKCKVCGYVEAEVTAKISHVHDFETTKRKLSKNPINDRFKLPNGYITDDYHVKFCARCTQEKEERHRFGFWKIRNRPFTDSKHVYHKGIAVRYCVDCGYSETKSFEDGKWPILTEVYDLETGLGTGGPANIGGSFLADPGDTVTVTATPFEGYLLADGSERQYGSWSFDEVTGRDTTKIDGKTYEFKNKDIKNIKLNADGSITFTMPDGPVGLMLIPIKCDHAGAETTRKKIDPSCTGYGSWVKVCNRCNGIVETTSYIDPEGHYWDIVDIIDPGNCYRQEVDKVRCIVCGAERERKSGVWHAGLKSLDNEVAPTCFRAGHKADLQCGFCGYTINGERIPAPGQHTYGPWTVLKEATTKVRGQRTRDCTLCGFTQNETIDFTGPDYRVKPDRMKLCFDFTYGEQPEPQKVHFTSIGRNEVLAISDVEERIIGNVTTQALDGMTLMVGAVPWLMVEWMNEDVELLGVTEADGRELSEPCEIEVRAIVRKTKQSFDLSVEGGKSYIDGKLKKSAKAAISVPGGEHLQLTVDDPAAFRRWEIVEDQSGYLKHYFDHYSSMYTTAETDFFMPANSVKLKALYEDSPGLFEITFDPCGGSMSKKTAYTNSAGEIDYLYTIYRPNYTFDGWWTSAAGGKRADIGTVLTQDTTLYAHWIDKVTAQNNPFPDVQYTPDSKAAVGRSLTVDIEGMGEFDERVMEAFLSDDVAYQWFKDGKLIPGQEEEILQLPDGYKGAQIHTVVCFDGHQIVGDPLTVGGDEDVNPFEDVKAGKFYYDAVLWAVAHEPQITNGTDATHFSPDATCTRGQVVTFLWRAAGCPEPKSTTHPFKDIKSGAFYYKAVLWAVENGITKGVSATAFGPNQGCTRGQVVTFLHRAAGTPDVKSGDNPFKDVKPGAFYEKAVAWAVANDITKGTAADKFSPDSTCTRGQIVTFLHRADNAEQKNFLLYVEAVYNIPGRGKAIAGTVARGRIQEGAKLRIQGVDGDFLAKAKMIQGSGKTLVKNAAAGDRILILIGSGSDKICEGDALISAEGPYQKTTGSVVGTLTMTAKNKPAFVNYHPNLWFFDEPTTPVSGKVLDLDGLEYIINGMSQDNVTLGEFSRPLTFYVGQTIKVMEHSHQVGTFTITSIPEG